MTRTACNLSLAAGLSAASLTAHAASAATLVALSGDQTLQMIDTETRKVGKTVEVKGLTAPLAGFDIRPADGQLYGLQRDGQIVIIDMSSGQATPKAKLDQMLPAGAMLTVDFNPVADRLRVVGSEGTNLRINVDDGKTVVDGRLKFAEGDANRAAAPKIVASAYTNKMKGAKETALYNLDGTTGALARQAPPNDGVLNTLGMLEAKPITVAFNIAADGQGGNVGWVVKGDMLSRIDLANGKSAAAGKIAGLKAEVRDIAVLPGM